jgi:gamma-carbonic anhydrase
MTPLILPYRGILPRIAASAFIAPGAVIVGDVEIGENASIWFGCVLRGDVAAIVVGADSNVQDGTVIHGSTGKPPTWIGSEVTIGHMVAAGALVTPGKVVPRGELWGGSPARFMRPLGDTERRYIAELPGRYVGLAAEHRRR